MHDNSLKLITFHTWRKTDKYLNHILCIQLAEMKIQVGLGGSGKHSIDENSKNCNWHKDTAEITTTKHFKNRLDKHLPDNPCTSDPRASKLPLKVPFSCTQEKFYSDYISINKFV